MTTPTWHLDKAKTSLNEWYDRADKYLSYQVKFDWLLGMRGFNKECKQAALKCKTLGLVFHERYKMLLEK